MFDLDKIEQEWQSLNLKLSEEQIIDIYRLEGATLSEYNKVLDEFMVNKPFTRPDSAENRLLNAIFNDLPMLPQIKVNTTDEEFERNWDEYCYKYLKHSIENYDEGWDYPEIEYSDEEKIEICIKCAREELKEKRKAYDEERQYIIFQNKYNKLKKEAKKHLSVENQKKVVTGSLDIVFSETRRWYERLDKKMPLEKIYYICLETLMWAVKRLSHNEKPTFSFYIIKCIENRMSLYSQHITEKKEEICLKPSDINYIKNKATYTHDFVSYISNNEFMKIYHKALSKLDPIEREVMSLFYDSNGYHILTYEEISKITGFDINEVRNAKRRAIEKLRKYASILVRKLELESTLKSDLTIRIKNKKLH